MEAKAMYYQGNGQFRVGAALDRPPKTDEAKLKIAYCGICGTDLHIYCGHMDARVGKNQITGHECSAEVLEVGQTVQNVQVGDRVVVRPLLSCGECPACTAGHFHVCQYLKFMGVDTEGAFQQFWTVPARLLHKLPEDMPLQRAALVEPLAVACHDLRLGEVQPGEFAVVLGGGPIGMLVALAALEQGAQVLLSEINPFRLELAKSLGLQVINPAEQDVEAFVNRQSNGRGADVVFEVTGTEEGAILMTKLPRVRGRIVVVAIYAFKPKVDLHRFFWREIKLCGARVYEAQDYEKSIHLLSGAIPFEQLITSVTPLSELQYGFEQLVNNAEAMKVLIDCQA